MRNRCPAEGIVHSQVSYPSRHEVLQQMAPQYRKTSRHQKTRVLNAFVTATGYSRTYAVQILNHPESLKAEIQRPRPARSCTEVQLVRMHLLVPVFCYFFRHQAHRILGESGNRQARVDPWVGRDNRPVDHVETRIVCTWQSRPITPSSASFPKGQPPSTCAVSATSSSPSVMEPRGRP